MTYEELMKRVETDDAFIRKVARVYLRGEGFFGVENRLELPRDSFAKLMFENPELKEKISSAIDREFADEQRIASKVRIRKALNTLSAAVDEMEDPQTTLKAALGILNFDTRLMRLGKKDEEDEDDIDKLWKEIGDELKAEKGIKSRKGHKQKVRK